MLQHVQETELSRLLDRFHAEQIELESILRTLFLRKQDAHRVAADIHRSAHEFAREACRDIEPGSEPWAAACDRVRAHPVHQAYLLQSQFIRHAFEKPKGYAGDMELMQLICELDPPKMRTYECFANDVYLALPAAEAVRRRVVGMQRILETLPDGARVLCLACGPALEVQRLTDQKRRALKIELLDHDPATIAYVAEALSAPNIRPVVANAFDIIKGATAFGPGPDTKNGQAGQAALSLAPRSYDLVYSMGLYDYVATFPMNPSRGTTGLTHRLFELVKPGGRLIVGNFLTPGNDNPHTISHRFMMEAFSDWKLIYRAIADIEAFASTISTRRYDMRLLDETLSNTVSTTSVIGFAEIAVH